MATRLFRDAPVDELSETDRTRELAALTRRELELLGVSVESRRVIAALSVMWPAREMRTSLAPAIAAAIRSALAGTVTVSSSPTMTRVGAVMRESS